MSDQSAALPLPRRPATDLSVPPAAQCLLVACVAIWYAGSPRVHVSDFHQIWFGIRTLLQHGDPYTRIGANGFPLLYPLTALIAVLPLAWFPIQFADPFFVGLGSAASAWALLRNGQLGPRAVMLVSASYLAVLENVQWEPLLIAGALLPAGFGWALACKPTIGAALWIWRPSWRSAAWGLGLAAVAFLWQPSWLREWLAMRSAGGHLVPPILYPGGFVLALALLRWRDPSARLLLALACMPQTPVLYTTLPLFLIPTTWVEASALCLAGYLAVDVLHLLPATTEYVVGMARLGTVLVWMQYVPALIIVLRAKR